MAKEKHSGREGRRAGWLPAAALAGLAIAMAAAPASADHGRYRSPGACVSAGYEWSRSRPAAKHRRHKPTKFELGYTAGRRDGWNNGYADGLYGRPCSGKPRVSLKGCPRLYRKGYRKGYTDAYRHGYLEGRRQCSRRRFGAWWW